MSYGGSVTIGRYRNQNFLPVTSGDIHDERQQHDQRGAAECFSGFDHHVISRLSASLQRQKFAANQTICKNPC
jgi:hypothetical protein